MSWLFSRALVEEYSEANSLDLGVSAPLSVMPTAHKFWRNDKTIEFSNLSLFGLTCAVLTGSRGEDLLTWFRLGFLARTYQSAARGAGLPVSVPASGLKRSALSMKYNPNTSLWKTHRCLIEEDLPESSLTLPGWVLMRRGELWELATPDWIMTAKGNGFWPTPTARDWKYGMTSETLLRRMGTRSNGVALPEFVMRLDGGNGKLSPEFLEVLMGWPIGWSALEPLEMDKFRQWEESHGIYCESKSKGIA